MGGWTREDLAGIGAAEEIEVASFREDGTLRPYVTIWVVPVDGELYVRSWHGRDAGWFRRASRAGEGRVRAGGTERDVRFQEPGGEVRAAIDAGYRSKYGRYGDSYVGPLVAPEAAAATFRLVPH
jgi:hypothetical protein